MEVKRLAGKKKIKKAERPPKRQRQAGPKTAPKPVLKLAVRREPKAQAEVKSIAPSENVLQGREFSMFQPEFEASQTFQISPSCNDNAKESKLGAADHFGFYYGVVVPKTHRDDIHEALASVVSDHRFFQPSEMVEDDCTMSIFQQEYRKVSRLDSPKMSLSSSIKGSSLKSFGMAEEPRNPPAENKNMFVKMQMLCAAPPKANARFQLIAPTDQASSQLGGLTDELDKSQNSGGFFPKPNKSSSRRSRRASRKNSSVENLNI